MPCGCGECPCLCAGSHPPHMPRLCSCYPTSLMVHTHTRTLSSYMQRVLSCILQQRRRQRKPDGGAVAEVQNWVLSSVCLQTGLPRPLGVPCACVAGGASLRGLTTRLLLPRPSAPPGPGEVWGVARVGAGGLPGPLRMPRGTQGREREASGAPDTQDIGLICIPLTRATRDWKPGAGVEGATGKARHP